MLFLLCGRYPLYSFESSLLSDYYRILNYPVIFPYYYDFANIEKPFNFTSSLFERDLNNYVKEYSSNYNLHNDYNGESNVNINGQIELNLSYGKAFSLKKGGIVGLGTEGINSGIKYDLIEKIIMQGSIYDRLFVDFNYDSTRSEKGISEEKNVYSVEYRGKNNEFVKSISIGNKYFKIQDSRYVPIDDGNQDSFALRFIGGRGDLTLEGLLRYDVSYKGEKHFSGFKRDVNSKQRDVEYVKGLYFFIPDKQINDKSLKIYRTTLLSPDIVVDNKNFKLLIRNVDFSFDNTNGFISLSEPLKENEELIVYYEKNGNSVGSSTLGIEAIIDTDGLRKNFNQNDFPDYFDSTKTYLYLKKKNFNSYWERMNIYQLEDFEGENIYNLKIEVYYTSNGGLNSYYNDLLSNYNFNPDSKTIAFNFYDSVGFYPRPFPGEKPYDPTLAPYSPGDPRNPFDPDNPIYGGINYPDIDNSIITLNISYSYYSNSFFLDFNLIPGSIEVYIDGTKIDKDEFNIDYQLGIIDFKEGVIKPSSKVDIYYRYSGFGGGNKGLLMALGFIYNNGPFYLHNLTSYRYPVGTVGASQVGTESPSSFINSTSIEYRIGKDNISELEDKRSNGFYLDIKGEAAISITNPSAKGLAIVADMESGENQYSVDLSDNNWMISTISKILSNTPYNLSFSGRGMVYYKNYYEKHALSDDELHTIDWSIPEDQVFDYSKKAGPYNTSDSPPEGEKKSLVFDYKMSKGSENPFISAVVPLKNCNLSGFNRFNILFKAIDIKGSVRIYVELLSAYNEDLNGNGAIDGEKSINDYGFKITPVGGTETVIGSDRYGKSNGRIDSEDINHNNILDTTENGVVIGDEINSYIYKIDSNISDFITVSANINNLIESNESVFQNPEAVRITIVPDSSQIIGGYLNTEVTGKIIINKIWFSGSEIKNNNPDYLNISEISIAESSDFRENSFSKRYPDIYDNLHGDSFYREKSGHIEKTLDVKLIKQLDAGSKISISRDFYSTVDFLKYKRLKIYFYLPAKLPQDLNIDLLILSSNQEYMEADFHSGLLSLGWNELTVKLDDPYTVSINGNESGRLESNGYLNVLKRVSKIELGFANNGTNPIDFFELWTDEWHLSDSRNYFDKAFYINTKTGYIGDIISLSGYPVLSNPELQVEAERKEGFLEGSFSSVTNTYSTNMNINIARYFNTGLDLKYSKTEDFREKDNVYSVFSPGENSRIVKNYFSFNLNKVFIPGFYHFFERTVSEEKQLYVTKDNFNFKEVNGYLESMGLEESIKLPLNGLQKYSYIRNWNYQREKTGNFNNFNSKSFVDDASLEQIHSINIGFMPEKWNADLILSRDEVFVGNQIAHYDSWADSYLYKVKTFFSPPYRSLSDATLYMRNDKGKFNFSLLSYKRVGFDIELNSYCNQSNYFHDQKLRDFEMSHSIYISFPFYFFGSNLSVVPSIYRLFNGKYDGLAFMKREEEILIENLKPLLRPPLFYISPFKGLGRVKDYDVVDYYKNSSYINGNSKNELYNKYSITLDIAEKKWFLFDTFNLWIDGDTVRDGNSYVQTRGIGFGMKKSFIQREKNYFDKSTNLTLEYKNEKNYLTKIVLNEGEIGISVKRLKKKDVGIIIDEKIKLSSENQRLNDSSFYLVPGDNEYEVEVPEKPDRLTINNDINFNYLWEYKNMNIPLINGPLKNIETIRLENIYTFVNRKKSESFSNVPFRITFKHISTYSVTNTIDFSAYIKIIGGIEERVIPPIVTGNILPSVGLEIGVSTKIIF